MSPSPRVKKLRLRRMLRKNQTPTEQLFWSAVRNKQLGGKRWRRQVDLGDWIVDFYCPSQKIAVELDGDYHFTDPWTIQRDQKLSEYLLEIGITLIRIENKDFENDPNGALEYIQSHYKNV